MVQDGRQQPPDVGFVLFATVRQALVVRSAHGHSRLSVDGFEM